ncbi:hypothetical protein BKA80DRAFT_260643 [Phyllosticta citrichinensis]
MRCSRPGAGLPEVPTQHNTTQRYARQRRSSPATHRGLATIMSVLQPDRPPGRLPSVHSSQPPPYAPTRLSACLPSSSSPRSQTRF